MGSMMSPGIALRLMPEQLSQRETVAVEFANTKDDTNPALSVGTATIAALVHQFREDGFTTISTRSETAHWSTELREKIHYVIDECSEARSSRSRYEYIRDEVVNEQPMQHDPLRVMIS
jgi:hypothetical protein